MLKNTTLLLLSLLLSQVAFAKKRITPSDDKVMIQIGDHSGRVPKALNPNEINIFAWNMYKGRMEGWEQDYKKLTPGHDILLLQELWMDGPMLKVFKEDQVFSYHMATAFIDTEENNAASGVGIASEVRPTKTFFQRSKYKEPFIGTHKMVLFASYPLEGNSHELLTGTIHAINFVSAKKLRHQLQDAAKAIKAHNGPVVFGGDFNTWSDKKLEYLAEFAKDAGLTEVEFPNGNERMTGKGKFLDYLFVKGVDVHDSYVHSQYEGSDHKALYVKISVK